MNLFLTIIPMMLFMLVMTQVALVALNFTQGTGGGGGGQGGGGGEKETKEIKIYLVDIDAPARNLTAGFLVQETGMDKTIIPFKNGNFDFVQLDAKLKEIRGRHPELREINVGPYPTVPFGLLIKAIDLCKSNEFFNVRYEKVATEFF
jgi:hypothetical protein